jgi:hypothetical protein
MDETSIREKLKKYENIISTYKYISEDEISTMNINSHVIYISKVGFKKKSGYLKSIRDTSILELYIFGRVWNIYLNKYYIFNRERGNKIKFFLQKLVNDDFKSLTITPKDE